MSLCTRRVRCLLLVGIVVALTASSAWAQGIESYSLVHPFGLSSATNTRLFGMGGQTASIWDRGSGNPAFAATHEMFTAGLRVAATDFDRGPDLISEQAHFIWPIEPNEQGLQISLFSLSAGASPVMLPGGPAVLDLSEEDLGIHYGRRLAPNLTAGIGLSPYSEIEFNLDAPGLPLMRVKTESDWGARLGLAYEYAPGDYAGLIYDYYQESATAVGLLVGGAATRVYHSDLLAIGASRHVRPDLLVSAEFHRASTNDGPMTVSLNGWHVGAEYTTPTGFAVRAGLNDERPTLGIGYADEQWQIDYCYMSRWNDDIVSGLFGGSDTHGLQAIYRW